MSGYIPSEELARRQAGKLSGQEGYKDETTVRKVGRIEVTPPYDGTQFLNLMDIKFYNPQGDKIADWEGINRIEYAEDLLCRLDFELEQASMTISFDGNVLCIRDETTLSIEADY